MIYLCDSNETSDNSCSDRTIPETPTPYTKSPHTYSNPAIRVIMMPRDTNALGTIFGGIILSYIDQAGAVEARKHSDRRFVTVAMREVTFVHPVFVGDLVSFYTDTVRIGRTSVTVHVIVEAQRATHPNERIRVTEAEVIYVAVNETGHPIPVKEPQNSV